MNQPKATGSHRTVLSELQWEIIRLLALGLTRKQVASEMGINPKTVEHHITGNDPYRSRVSIRDILGFHDPARLTHYAIKENLVTAGEPLPKKEREQ